MSMKNNFRFWNVQIKSFGKTVIKQNNRLYRASNDATVRVNKLRILY